MKSNSLEKNLLVAIKVTPKASHHLILGWENGELKIKLAAMPEKGEANLKLIQFLAKILKLPKSRMTLVSGHTSRHKKISIEGMTEEEWQTRINEVLVRENKK